MATNSTSSDWSSPLSWYCAELAIKDYEELADVNAEINLVNNSQKEMLEQKDAAMAALADENAELKRQLSLARNLLVRIARTESTGIEGLVRRVQQ